MACLVAVAVVVLFFGLSFGLLSSVKALKPGDCQLSSQLDAALLEATLSSAGYGCCLVLVHSASSRELLCVGPFSLSVSFGADLLSPFVVVSLLVRAFYLDCCVSVFLLLGPYTLAPSVTPASVTWGLRFVVGLPFVFSQ